MPPAIMVQRFCIMLQAAMSSQVQVIFMPPVHFSIFMVQRGTIIMFGAIGPIGIVPDIPIPGAPEGILEVDIGFIIVVTMIVSIRGWRIGNP